MNLSIKEIKVQSKKTLKKSYWAKVIICFIVVYLAVASGIGAEMLSFEKHDSSLMSVVDESYEVESPGLVDYFVARTEGSEHAARVAQDIMDSFKGTGGVLYTVIQNVYKIVLTNSVAAIIALVLGTVILLFYNIGIKNLLYVRYMRFTLESRTYEKTGFKRIIPIFRTGGSWNIMKVTAVKFVRLFLFGSLTVLPLIAFAGALTSPKIPGAFVWLFLGLSVLLVVGFLRYYLGLFFVPYIMAVNPQTKRKGAFALSRQMMRGNYFRFIRLELSFIGWFILSILTFGLLDIFFLRPYVYQARAEFFIQLRGQYLKNQGAYSYALQDRYLTATEEDYLRGVSAAYICDTVSAEYPTVCTYRRRSPAMEKFRTVNANMNPERKYSIFNLILFFFCFAFIGYAWEVFLHIIKDGVFVNRGMMYGPWLPIYGFGGVIVVIFFRRFAKDPKKLALASLLAFGTLEYFTSWFFEKINGIRWWDYSNCLLNLNGRICLEGLLVFVLAGVAVIYFVAPLLDNFFNKMRVRSKMLLVFILLVCFLADFTYCRIHGANTGKGITAYAPDPVIETDIWTSHMGIGII